VGGGVTQLSDRDLATLYELACHLPERLGCDVQREVERERARRRHEDEMEME